MYVNPVTPQAQPSVRRVLFSHLAQEEVDPSMVRSMAQGHAASSSAFTHKTVLLPQRQVDPLLLPQIEIPKLLFFIIVLLLLSDREMKLLSF